MDLRELTDKLYMNPLTGSVDTRDGWDYITDDGRTVNAVDLGEVVEVLPDKDNGFVEVTP